MLKNLTVVTQRVKNKSDGLAQYSNYLLNQNAKSHKSTEIIDLHFCANDPDGYMSNFLSENISNTIEFDINNKKGGRKVESYAQSLVFSLPSGFPPPTQEQWKNIYLDIFKEVSNHLITEKKDKSEVKLNTVDLKDIFTLTLGVAHNQKNPHLNVVIPRIIKRKSNGELVRLDNIDRKSFLNSAKKAFNAAALKHLALDFNSYKPENSNTGKSLTSWQKQQQQALAAQTEAALAQEKASKMLQEAAEKQIEAQKMLTEAKNKEIEITTQIRKFDLFKESFNMIFNAIKYYLGNTTKQAKLEDKKMVEEEYKSVSKNPFFEENHKEILQLAAAEVDQEIEDEDEKLSPIFRVKYK